MQLGHREVEQQQVDVAPAHPRQDLPPVVHHADADEPRHPLNQVGVRLGHGDLVVGDEGADHERTSCASTGSRTSKQVPGPGASVT